MEFRNLGEAGLRVSVAGLGTNNFGGRLDQAGTTAVVQEALDQGITLFDTADMYGDGLSEEYLGKALGSRRPEVIVATKFGNKFGEGPYSEGASRHYIYQSVEASLRRLGTDYIDLYQLHTPDARTPIEETLRALDDLVRAGKIRYIGSSNFAGWEIADADWTARAGGLSRFVTAQNEWSLLKRGVERDVIPACERFRVGMLPYFPLASGFLTGKYQRGEEFAEGTRLRAWGTRMPDMVRDLTSDANWDRLAGLSAFAEESGHTVHELAIGWLASRPDIMAPLEIVLLVLLVPFAIGLWTRVAYNLFAVGISIWALVWIESQHSNAHQLLATIAMVLCLLPVPWGAALSMDEPRRRRRGAGNGSGLRGKVYGYPMWMPGLILGSVWASAAYAKLDSSGPAWILGGAVKYHWVIDAPTAAVDWGLWVAGHHWAAVFMAFCGVFFEAVFILSVFMKPGPWRHLLTSTGLALLIGFYLFHGVLWWTWWLAFLSFVIPWEPLYTLFRSRGRPVVHGNAPLLAPTPAGPRGHLRPIHLALIVLVCVHAMLRLPAGFGRFGSYSGTYASTEEFDRINPIDPTDRLWAGFGTTRAVEVDARMGSDAILALARDEPLSPAHASRLRELDQLPGVSAEWPRRLTLTRQQTTFDWTRGRFNPPGPAVVVGTLDLESMTLVED